MSIFNILILSKPDARIILYTNASGGCPKTRFAEVSLRTVHPKERRTGLTGYRVCRECKCAQKRAVVVVTIMYSRVVFAGFNGRRAHLNVIGNILHTQLSTNRTTVENQTIILYIAIIITK